MILIRTAMRFLGCARLRHAPVGMTITIHLASSVTPFDKKGYFLNHRRSLGYARTATTDYGLLIDLLRGRVCPTIDRSLKLSDTGIVGGGNG